MYIRKRTINDVIKWGKYYPLDLYKVQVHTSCLT